MGGGSAEAAAPLAALMDLGQVDLAPESRDRLALSLGADLPVCLAGRPARMRGIGETLEALPPLPRTSLVLVNPRLPCPTGPVFKARAGAFSAPPDISQPPAS